MIRRWPEQPWRTDSVVLTAEGQEAATATARGTLAPHFGEQAAEGQTARLRLAKPPRCKPLSQLALCLER